MEDCQPPERGNVNNSLACEDTVFNTHQEESGGVDIIMEENLAVVKELDHSCKSEDVFNDLVSPLSRDSTAISADFKQEVPVGENLISASTNIVEESYKEKASVDCSRHTPEPSQPNEKLMCNSVNFLNEKSELNISKEVHIEAPHASIKKEEECGGVDIIMDENVAVVKELDHSCKSEDVFDDLVSSLSRDSTAISADFKQEVPVGENLISASANIVEESYKEKATVDCSRHTPEPSQPNEKLMCNSVNFLDEKSELNISKEVDIEAPHASIKKDEESGGVDIIMEENVAVVKELDHSCKSEDVFDLVSPLSRDSTADSAHSKQEVPVGENLISASANIVEESYKEKATVDCTRHTPEPSQPNEKLMCNSVNFLNEKSEVVIMKEVDIEAPHASIKKEQSAKCNSPNFSKGGYRCESDSWTDDDENSSDSSSSDSDPFFQTMRERSVPKKLPFVKTKGELGLDDLPPIEDLIISVNEKEMSAIGKVHAIVEKLVVVHALKDMKALDIDSVLFLSHNQPLGRVFDVFGPVSEPFYSVRFNSVDEISDKSVEVGTEVFFAPENDDITSYVFVDKLQNEKGSDASWKHNNEPPVEFLDYSDDEKEKYAKHQRMAKNRNKQFSNASNIPAKKPLLTDNSTASHFIPPSKFASQYNSNINKNPSRFSKPFNPFKSHVSPSSPSSSVSSSIISPVRIQNSFRASTPHPARRQPQNAFYRPSPPLVLSPYPQPHIFGQLTVLNPITPAMIPASQFSHASPQNYFSQRFPRNPSPAEIRPAQHQLMSTDCWLPDRPPDSASVPPSYPLTVQIPTVNSPFPMQQFSQDRGSMQQFSQDRGSMQQFSQDRGSMQQFSQGRGSMQQFSQDRGSVHQFSQDRGSMQQFSQDSGSVQQFSQGRGSMQQFLNYQNGNFNEPFINNRNFPSYEPRYYHN